MTMMTDRTCVYTRSMTVKFIECSWRDGAGVTKTLTAANYDLPTDVAELEALHILLGEMLGCADEKCPCVAAGAQAQRERHP